MPWLRSGHPSKAHAVVSTSQSGFFMLQHKSSPTNPCTLSCGLQRVASAAKLTLRTSTSDIGPKSLISARYTCFRRRTFPLTILTSASRVATSSVWGPRMPSGPFEDPVSVSPRSFIGALQRRNRNPGDIVYSISRYRYKFSQCAIQEYALIDGSPPGPMLFRALRSPMKGRTVVQRLGPAQHANISG